MLHSFFNQTNTMAKVKQETELTEKTVGGEQPFDSGLETQSHEDSVQEKKSKTKGSKAEDLPENIKSVLKAFSDHKEVYVNKFGGVFAVDTDEYLLGEGATLYQNPFYKG